MGAANATLGKCGERSPAPASSSEPRVEYVPMPSLIAEQARRLNSTEPNSKPMVLKVGKMLATQLKDRSTVQREP